MKRKAYYFVLVLSGVNEYTEGLEDALFEAGCDDALISYKNGVVCLDFDREANSLDQAILSAIKDIETSGVGAKANHIEGAFVTISEIAERSGYTKQAISLFIQGKRGPGDFPVPFAGINSNSPIWRWRDVVRWLQDNHKIDDQALFDEADTVDSINGALELRNAPLTNVRKHMLNSLPSSKRRGV
jgi:hypothetical protein